MKIIRIYNNNVVVVCKENEEEEMIVIGKGLAFQKKPGEEIDASKIEKIFTLKDPNEMTKLEKLISDIPFVYLTIAEEIVALIKRESDLQIKEKIYVTLTDHISTSVEREREGIIHENPLLLEIKQFYKTEFQMAEKSADIIKKHTGVEISQDEMGFIALHIVNASMNQRAKHTLDTLRMIQEIVEIVESHFGWKLEENSLHYDRFVRHLQFFARRMFGEVEKQAQDEFLYELGKERYPKGFACASQIEVFLQKKYQKEVTRAEKGYLVYHITALEAAQKKK